MEVEAAKNDTQPCSKKPLVDAYPRLHINYALSPSYTHTLRPSAMEQSDSRRIHNTLFIYLPIRVRHKRQRCTNGQGKIRNWGQS